MPRGIPNTPKTSAKHNPVILPKTLETAEQEIGGTSDRVLRSTGDAGDALDKARLVQKADRMPDPEKAAMLAFMNEQITIRIGDTTDPNAEQIFEITINNKTELFKRGESKTVRRCFVDLMARAKVTRYSQKETTNAEGIKQMLYPAHTACKYDFAVIRDDNPMGSAWLKATLAMPG
jgi:hypothetical protein